MPPPANLYGQSIGRKGAATRERLLDATVELLERRSLREINVADIAALAGTSASGFYVYFPDVEAAALEIANTLEQITPEIEALLRRTWTPNNAHKLALALLRHYIDFARRHHALIRVRNLAADEGDTRFGAARHQALARLHDLLAARIGEASTLDEPHAGASAVLALMERTGAISRVPLGHRHSQSQFFAAAAFLIASVLASRDPTPR